MTFSAARGFAFCEHCGSFHFPEGAGDGVRVLGPSPDPRLCPRCDQSLQAADLDAQHRALFCERCRGVLLARADFAAVLQRRRAWAKTPPRTPVPLDRQQLERRVRCPACGQWMETHPYLGPGAIVIDTCAPCDVVWLDPGELGQAVDAPGRDRGSSYRQGESAAEFTTPVVVRGMAGDGRPPDLLDVLRDWLTE